jgi:hypothetical protein
MASKAQMIGSTAATQPETAAEEREVLLRSTHTRFIYSAGDNLAMNWRIGFRLNGTSRNESSAPLQ